MYLSSLFQSMLLFFSLSSCATKQAQMNAAQPQVDTKAQVATAAEIKTILARHNVFRSAVGVTDIAYSEELAEAAKAWVTQLNKNGCKVKHSRGKYGENIFQGTAGYYTVGDAVDAWGSEKKDYNYKRNRCKTGKVCGHYTQMVWKSTTQVGCAQTTCKGTVIWVCEYDPRGNYIGQKPY